MNRFIWHDGKLRPTPHKDLALVITIGAPFQPRIGDAVYTPIVHDERVFRSHAFGKDFELKPKERRYFARCGTRGRRGVKSIGWRYTFRVYVFLEGDVTSELRRELDRVAGNPLVDALRDGWKVDRIKDRRLKKVVDSSLSAL